MNNDPIRPRGDEPLDELPSTYAELLRLLRAGRTSREIAERLDVPPEALPAMAELARRKLERLSRDDGWDASR